MKSHLPPPSSPLSLSHSLRHFLLSHISFTSLSPLFFQSFTFLYFTDIFCVDIRIRCDQKTDTLTVAPECCIVERSLSTQSVHTHTSHIASHEITIHTHCDSSNTIHSVEMRRKKVSQRFSFSLSLFLSLSLSFALA